MIRWLSVVTGSLALVALWALPPSRLETPFPRWLPEQARLDALSREVGRLNGALRAQRWADSLTALALREAEDGVALGPPATEGSDADPEDVRRWSERERARFQSLRPRDPELVVGLFWQPYAQGAQPDLPIGAGARSMTFVGERDGRAFCVRAAPYTPQTLAESLGYPMDPGPCILYAKYGLPGDQIQAWLDASSMSFARVSVPTYASDIAQTLLPSEPPPLVFGLTRPFLADQSLTVQACLAGRPAACERAVADPALLGPAGVDATWVLTNSPASGLEGGPGSPPFDQLDDALLFELEASFGTEAFARFWRSSAPVPEAFEAAFGEPLGEWILRWVEARVELYRAGPALPWGTLGWSLLALALLGAAVTRTASRRRVA